METSPLMFKYTGSHAEANQYLQLPRMSSFRVFELLQGQDSDPIACKMHVCEWDNLLKYDAISYAWGDPNVKRPITIDGGIVEVTKNLHSGLVHLRLKDSSRLLWADAVW
jgi:hypothetical protein